MLLLVTLICSAFIYYINRDIFSPAKLLLVNVIIFHANLFVGDYLLEISATYILYLILVLFVALLEVLYARRRSPSPNGERCAFVSSRYRRRVHVFFWLLSFPSIVSQVYMFNVFGGLYEYISILPQRVVLFRGMGHYLFIIGLFKVISLLYLACVLVMMRSSKRGSNKLGVFLVVFHLLIAICLGLISGSRGNALMPIVSAIITFHYLYRPIKISTVLIAFVALLLSSSVLEVARNGIKYADGEVSIHTGDETLGNRYFSYGLIPLDLIYEQGIKNYHLGATYITLVTNVVPRGLWPRKPDTGGVIFTKEYTGDAWDGYSNLATGLLPEAFMNFGYVVGLIVAIFQFVLFYILVIRYYKRIYTMEATSVASGMWFVGYLFFYQSLSSVFIAEFTNLFLNLILKLIFIALVIVVFRFLVGVGPFSAYRYKF